MKIKNRAIKLLAGTIMVCFLSGSILSLPVLAETTVAVDSSVSDSVLLNDLQCSPVDIDFSPNVNSYRIVVPEGTEKILVSAQLSDPSSIYRVIGNSNLQSGSNDVSVEVEDMNGNKNVYEIQVIVGELNEEETTEEETTEKETFVETSTSAKEQSMAVVSSQGTIDPSVSATPDKTSSFLDNIKGFVTDQKNFMWILCGIAALVILLIILCIILTLRKSKRKKIQKTVKSEKQTSKKTPDSKPVITHDLSWTKERTYDEKREDKILSDLMQSLKEENEPAGKEEQKESSQPSTSDSAEIRQEVSTSNMPETEKVSEENDEDDAFEIVDIDKL